MTTPTQSWIPFYGDVYTPEVAYWHTYPFINPDVPSRNPDPDPDPDAEDDAPAEVWIEREAMTPQQVQATIDALRMVAANLLQHADALAQLTPETA